MPNSGTLNQAYEERFLFLLMLLRQPRLRMVYVTSLPIAPEIVEYYLALLPGVIPSHARARLCLVSVNDASPRSLSEKLLARPRVLARIAAWVPNRAAVAPHPVQHDRARARCRAEPGHPDVRRGPTARRLGSKTGCRRLFAELGVPHPWAPRTCTASTTWPTRWSAMRAQRPSMGSAIVKLNEGVSGAGTLSSARGLPRRAPQRSGGRSSAGWRRWSSSPRSPL